VQILSVNVGLPREVPSEEEPVLTGIFKSPVEGRVRIERLNLAGDRQADLSVHGGPNKAVYGYPSEHYAYWKRRLGREEIPWGMFGENLTFEGLLEDSIHLGDSLRAGTALLRVTQPRIPCYKLGIRFGRADMVKKFQLSGRSGFYFSVVEEGDVAAGDRVEIVERSEFVVTVAECVQIYYDRKNSHPERIRRILQITTLPPGLRKYFTRRLEA
jgi:MOSC domain-containing protein YiiM